MTTETTPAPIIPPAPADTGEAAVLAQKLAESNARGTTLAAQLATLTGERATLISERDTFKAQIADLTPKAAQAAELAVKVTDLTNTARESSFVEALRNKLPGADPIAIRGVLGELAKAGKVNRFPEDPAAELAKALPIITEAAPSLTRPPTNGGGTPGARQTPSAPARKSLVG